jgi:hypothetical protein
MVMIGVGRKTQGPAAVCHWPDQKSWIAQGQVLGFPTTAHSPATFTAVAPCGHLKPLASIASGLCDHAYGHGRHFGPHRGRTAIRHPAHPLLRCGSVGRHHARARYTTRLQSFVTQCFSLSTILDITRNHPIEYWDAASM